MDCDPHANEQPDDECRVCACDLDQHGNCPGCVHREEYHPDAEPGWLCDDWANRMMCAVERGDDWEEDYDDAAAE